MSKIKLKTLKTPESENLNGNEWSEVYPRPQMRRDSFISLNGEWSISNRDGFEGKITVPFPPESEASGIGKRIGNLIKYKKTFNLDKIEDSRIILNIDAVDQSARVAINGEHAFSILNGITPNSFDITEFVRGGENEIQIDAFDKQNSVNMPYGKQRKKRGGMWYTTVSGLWKSVWLEIVPKNYIKDVKIVPNGKGAKIFVDCKETVSGGKVVLKTEEGEKAFDFDGYVCDIALENPHKWSPDDPFLYEFDLICGKDTVHSYFAVRTIDIKEVDGVPRILLNGEPIFFHGLLDQGYYPEGLYTPVSPKSIENDILMAKKLGFNTLRKHIKVEHELFYYYCDKHGMFVFQDMVNNGKYSFFHDTALPTLGFKSLKEKRATKRNFWQWATFTECMKMTVHSLYNHPCIVYWTIFNEGWGQIDSQKMFETLKMFDTTRVIDTASGWFKGADTDVESEHIYFKEIKGFKKSHRPIILSEFGGYSCKIADHSANEYKTYGYGKFEKIEDFENAVVSLYREQVIPQIKNGLCGAIYTQITDVEDETNGIATYDRQVIKLNDEKMQEIAKEIEKSLKGEM